MKFTKRNEKGLHCRFCYAEIGTTIPKPDLYETSPVSGIVCQWCKPHLEEYLKGVPNK